MSEIELDAPAYTEMFVKDPTTGNPVTGLLNVNFTKKLYNPSGTEVSGSITVTVSELGLGFYRVTFTPNVQGNWLLVVIHATYSPNGMSENFQCNTKLNNILRTLGLTHENIFLDQTVIADGKVTSRRLRIYSVAGSVGTDSDVIATYTLTFTYTLAGIIETYKAVKS